SLQLSRNPAVLDWVAGGEKNLQLGKYAQADLQSLGKDYDYSNSFIVSALTNHYWAENGSLLGTVSLDEPKDVWFYNALKSRNRVALNLDFDKLRQNTSVFVNTLMGDLDNPVAIVGVGLNLNDIAAEFQNYKFGANSSLWLIDQNGKICLSDQVIDDGKNLSELLPPTISQEILDNIPVRNKNNPPKVTSFSNEQGELQDLVYQPLKSADWTLVFLIPREESLAVINPIRTHTIAVVAITVFLLIVIFYMVSNRIANPYKRALSLNIELERQVNLRTQELKEKNDKIMDSIEYAKTIQEAMLPSSGEISRLFKEHFVLWRPRDVVGGDFYWGRKFPHGRLIIVGDCTGHGVPGALMTMAVISMIDHIVTNITQNDPALIINELHRLLGLAFQVDDGYKRLDDGLDAGVCYIAKDGQFLFAGAKMGLYHASSEGIRICKGSKHSIGCRKKVDTLIADNHIIIYAEGDAFYLSSDGYWDQNDAEKNHSFGIKRYRNMLAEYSSLEMSEQRRIFEEQLETYMQGEQQRDDITVIGFRV
ncbi:MAG: SpoIIE family protein phosphatase, partial [Syntrophomonas sp.]|nr:SpoIIE family protein phosphatase [Syntrophomonas sp.]